MLQWLPDAASDGLGVIWALIASRKKRRGTTEIVNECNRDVTSDGLICWTYCDGDAKRGRQWARVAGKQSVGSKLQKYLWFARTERAHFKSGLPSPFYISHSNQKSVEHGIGFNDFTFAVF